ncbi:helix-turn-helix transcriptional regulator [Lacisediminihabitans profunda]
MFRSGESKALREEAGISQAEFARAVGVSRSAVCQWESDSRSPRTEVALRCWSVLSRLRTVVSE